MRLLLCLIAMVCLSACGGRWVDPLAARDPRAPAWPPPPAQSRVEYVMSITSHQDLFEESGFWNRVANAVGGPKESRLVRPYSVAVHPAGGLLVGDPGAGRVHFFDWDRRRYVAIGDDVEGGLPSPVGIAVRADGSILVSDSRRGRVELFALNGSHVGSLGDAGTFKRPSGIGVLEVADEVAVVDVLDHTVKVLDSTGALVRTIGTKGLGEAAFNFPTHLAVGHAGDLLIADSMNFRIQRITTSGEFLSSFGEPGNAQGNFAQPKGVAALDAGTFVAVEGRFDSIVFFDNEARLLLSIGGPGSGPGEFWLPAGLAYDSSRRLLFVADSYNARVQVFRLLPLGAAADSIGEVVP